MIDDARWQYQQSVDNAYEDWHPPLMAWIWHYLMLLEPGPGPMLVLQAAPSTGSELPSSPCGFTGGATRVSGFSVHAPDGSRHPSRSWGA